MHRIGSMARSKIPVTAAVRALRASGVDHSVHLYRYESHPGALGGATALGLDPHLVVKTLIMEDDSGSPLVVLMHGDREVSTKTLARIVGVRSISPSDPAVAQRHSGYLVGGTSPFGLRIAMPLYMERSITACERIYLNGGKRGFLIGLAAADVVSELSPTLVDVAVY